MTNKSLLIFENSDVKGAQIITFSKTIRSFDKTIQF